MALTQVDQGLLGQYAQYTGFKNRIINGAMGIWQRGTSFTSSSYIYSADRWADGVWGASTTCSQSTSAPSGFQYSLKVQRPAAGVSTTIIGALQTIESVNCYDLAGQTVTLSFWAKAGANYSSSGNSLGIQIPTGTVADQGGNSYGSWTGLNLNAQTAILTTSWQKFTYTVTFGAGVLEAGVLFYYVPSGTAGADDSFYITGVQLEKGSTATSFDYRPYGTELALCQRYYWQLASGGDYSSFSAGVCQGTTEAFLFTQFPVPMRSAPSVTPSSVSNFRIYTAGSAFTVTSFINRVSGAVSNSYLSTNLDAVVASGLTAGYGAVLMNAPSTSTTLAFSSEL